MSIDVKQPFSPGWWLNRCNEKLRSRQERLKRLFDRYEGSPVVPEWLYDAPDAAKKYYRASRTGFAEMIVKAPLRRVRVRSILTSAESSEIGDEDAWRVWRRSGMLAEATDIHRTMLIAGDAYAILGVDDTGPFATSEDPRQVVTIHDPVRQSKIRAGAKFFTDEDTGTSYGFLYMPGRVFVARSTNNIPLTFTNGESRMAFSPHEWEWDPDRGGAEGEPWPDGMDDFIGIVRYRNDEGVGEFERHEDILNRIDHIILQGMVVATMQAFKQRAIKVNPADMPDYDPNTGEEIDYDAVFSADPGALWKLPDTAELWESGQVDLNGILSMAEKEIHRLSAVTFTPLSMFNSDAVNQSAAGAELVKEGLTDKVESIHERCEQPHAMVASALLRLAGLDDRADLDSIRIGWAPPVRYSLAEKGTAATQAKASDVPWRTRMSNMWQFSPEEVSRMEAERMEEAVLFPEEVNAAPTALADADRAEEFAQAGVNTETQDVTRDVLET